MARHHRGRERRGGRQASPRRGSGGSGRDEANSSGGADAGNRNGHDDDHSCVGQSQAGPLLAAEPAALLRKEFEAIGIHVRRQASPRGSSGSGRDEANSSGGADDHSRVGQSRQPAADQSQAGPPLPEEPAALLRKEFEAIGIHVRRAESVFPPRPGYGAAGTTPSVGRANRFLGRLAGDEGVHEYNVTISPDPMRRCPRAARVQGGHDELVSENQHTELGGRFPAYDCPDSLFTAGALRPFNSKEFEVTLSAGGDKRKHKLAISLLQLRMLLAGYPTDIPAQALQVLKTVLLDVVFNERQGIERGSIGANDHTLGVDAWKGLYHSIRSTQDGLSLTIADVCSSVFLQTLLLLDFVQKILKIDVVDRNLTEPQYDKLLKALRDVKIEVTHLGNKHHRYRIAGLSVKSTNDLSSESPSGATKTVIDHFRERYSLDLKYKSFPCLNVGSEQKPIYLPIEVCKIVSRQCYQKRLECSQVSTLRKSTSIQPEPEQSSHQVVDRKCTQCASESSIEFDDNLTTVDARVLLPTNYHDSGSQKLWSPINGYWNMKDKKLINGANISNWACVNFLEDLLKKVIKEFPFKMAEMSRITGADMYGYPIEIQALFSIAVRCALSWLDFGTLNDIYSYKIEEYSHTALSKFNVISESISDCIFDFMPINGGYFIGNVGPAKDFCWFCLGFLIATLSSLATREQGKAILDIVEGCWQRLIGEVPLKICYPAMESQEWQTTTGCDPKNTRWNYHSEGWPDAAWKAIKRSIVYLRGQPTGTVAAMDKSRGTELSDTQPKHHGLSTKKLMDIVQKMSVSNKVTICLDKSEDESDDRCLESYQAGIGAARLWCLKYGLHYDFSHIYGDRVFSFTTPPGGTFYITLKLEGRSITVLLAGRDLYIKGWRDELHGSYEIRMKHCDPYMLGKVKVVNIKKNYSFLCPDSEVRGTRIGPEALREAFNILFKCKGERSPEVRRAIGMLAVNISEAIRIQKVYKTVVKSFVNSSEQVLDPIPPDQQTQDPEDTNTLWIENYGHYSHQAMLDAEARNSRTDPPGIGNRDGADIQSATEIFREIRVALRDACSKGQNEVKPQKIEDPDDKINQSFVPKPETRKQRRRKGKILESEESTNAESVALFLLEDWLPEDEIDQDEKGDKESEEDDDESEKGDQESESQDEIVDDKQASKAEEVRWVDFSIGKFLERRMQEQIRSMRVTDWLSNKLQKTETFHHISQLNAERMPPTPRTMLPPKPRTMLHRNTISLGQRLMHRVSRCLRFL